ncbi:MAG: hypothetical protein QGF90_12310 [Gammaproteobacteria bacterium]|jgi:hypothetical protein|nr:hypothetical protein [Gammaproteobacteria bacterium]
MPKKFQPKVLFVVTSCLLLGAAVAQQIELNRQIWSSEVIRDYGQPVIPLFDGWYPNDDGSSTMCFGYFNMNHQQALDIPLGENNKLSDTRFAAQLPTHFDPLPPRYRHVFCAFTVTVPSDFGVDEKIVWNLTSNGQSLSVPGKLIPPYVLDEPASHGRGNLAPLVRLAPGDAGVRGRTGVHTTQPIAARVGQPLDLRAWIEHPDDQVWVGWSHHSGPGEVRFDRQERQVVTSMGAADVQASFSETGEYVVRMQTIDSIAAFEFYCCHTNAYFHINVVN